MRKLVVFALLAVLLAGCITYGNIFPTYPVATIQPNVTTQREIFSLFGEPYRKGIDNGLETWTYSYHYWELGVPKESRELYVVFNKDSTVRSYSYTSK